MWIWIEIDTMLANHGREHTENLLIRAHKSGGFPWSKWVFQLKFGLYRPISGYRTFSAAIYDFYASAEAQRVQISPEIAVIKSEFGCMRISEWIVSGWWNSVSNVTAIKRVIYWTSGGHKTLTAWFCDFWYPPELIQGFFVINFSPRKVHLARNRAK